MASFGQKGAKNLNASCLYLLGEIQSDVERFDMNFLGADDEMRNYCNVIQKKLQQLEDLMQTTAQFTEISEAER